MELEGSLPHSQEPATCPYPQPARSSPYPHIPLPEDPTPNSHLCLGLPSGLFLQVSPPKPCICLSSPPYTTCPAHVILDFITCTILGKEYRSLSYSLCTFIHSLVTSSLLRPNVLLSTLFSDTLSLRSSNNVSDQVSHPYKTTSKIIFLYISVFKFLDIKLDDRRFYTEKQQAFPDFNLLLLSSFIVCRLPPDILTSSAPTRS